MRRCGSVDLHAAAAVRCCGQGWPSSCALHSRCNPLMMAAIVVSNKIYEGRNSVGKLLTGAQQELDHFHVALGGRKVQGGHFVLCGGANLRGSGSSAAVGVSF